MPLPALACEGLRAGDCDIAGRSEDLTYVILWVTVLFFEGQTKPTSSLPPAGRVPSDESRHESC